MGTGNTTNLIQHIGVILYEPVGQFRPSRI